MAKILWSKNKLIRPRGYRKPARFFLDGTHPLNKGLIGYWPLGSNLSGRGEPDIVGRSPANVAVAQTVVGSHHGGTASSFNGSTQWMDIPSVPDFDSIPGSWCIWIKTSSLNGGWPMIMGRNNGFPQNFRGISLFIDNGTSKVRCQIKNASTISADFTGGPAAITDGAWHFIVITFTATGNCVLYIDGVNVGSATASPTWAFATNNVELSHTTETFFTFFLGSLADAMIYNRILTPEEVRYRYTEPYAGIFDLPQSLVGTSAVRTRSAALMFG